MTILKSCTSLLLCLLLATACRNAAQKQDSSDVANDKNDQKLGDKGLGKQAALIVEVIAANYQSLQLAELAGQKSANPDMQQIAGGLKETHTALLDRFKAYAAKKDISIPGDQTKEAREAHTKLDGLAAGQFEKKWCELLIELHQKTIADIESALNDMGEEDEGRKLFSEALPPLREQNDKLMQYHHRF